MLDHGAPASIRPAISEPMPRTEDSPRRTAADSEGIGPPLLLTGSPAGSRLAAAWPSLTSGRRTTTPCRLASATRLWGDQNPMGWALSSPAVKAAG